MKQERRGSHSLAKEAQAVPVYQLKVTLDDIKLPIWLRIQARGDVSLEAMRWEGYHLHQFIVGEEYCAVPSPKDPWPMETKNEKRAKLFQVAPAEKAKFIHEYDLGDCWYHDILVEKILHAEGR